MVVSCLYQLWSLVVVVGYRRWLSSSVVVVVGGQGGFTKCEWIFL